MDPNVALKYPVGSKPNIHYLAYLIFCAYIVSLIGAFTTVELLHRRVSGSGWRSWVQLAACAVSFGLVAIWCMHFVGNRAIVLGDGEEEIQLYYSSTFTTLSAILPIVVIFLGLSIADRFNKGSKCSATRYVGLIICGVCAGAAVTEMHYLGNQGTTDYRIDNSWPFIVGAASIAVGACCISLGLFFYWSGLWINNIWRRFIVACFLAVAVCGMHWTAAVGTTYELRGYHSGPGQGRNVNLIIALSLCLSACGVCFAIGFLKQRHRKKLKDRAQEVVLAVVTFDREGRMLVTQGGLLPCQSMTRQFHQRTFAEDFNPAHPVFQWLYRVSRNWSGIVDLIPAMRDHLVSTGYVQSHSPVMRSGGRASFSAEDNSSFSATFRELFCVTAQDMARSLETRLQDLGHLYEDVLTTGTLLTRTFGKDAYGSKLDITADMVSSPKDVEVGMVNPIPFGRGQLLVLTRKVGTDEANRLQNIGYRFGSLEQVGDHIARSLQISRDDLNSLINRLQLFCEREPWVPTAGTYLASFLLQPSPVMSGLDVIVPRLTPDRLPMVRLASGELSTRCRKVLSTFDGLSLNECLQRIQRCGSAPDDEIILEKFRNKIYELLKEVPEPSLRQATFSALQLDMAHGPASQKDKSQARVFAFCGIKEVYNQSLRSQTLKCVPMNFFKTYLRTNPGCPDHAILAQKNHKEFGTLLASTSDSEKPPSRSGYKWSFWRSKKASYSETTLHPDSCSEKGLVNATTGASGESAHSAGHPFGGIMVSQDIVINEDNKDDSRMELQGLGVRSEAGVADSEQQTMADRLMSITTSFRDAQGRLPSRDDRR